MRNETRRKGSNGIFMEREVEKSEMWLVIIRDQSWSSGVGGNRGGKGFPGI